MYQTGADYLVDFVSPNFFFHMSMIYALLRVQGVTLAKDGLYWKSKAPFYYVEYMFFRHWSFGFEAMILLFNFKVS